MRLLSLLCAGASLLTAQSWPSIRLQQVAGGFANPTDIAAPPGGSGLLRVLEQPGRVRAIRNGAVLPEPVLTLRTLSFGGERGLLGVAFPPGFSTKRHFYLNYTDPQGASVISRFRVREDLLSADLASEQVILRIARNRSNHNGGGIAFGPDGYLYVGTGDSGGGGDPDNVALNLNELRGKMLRIDTESAQTPYAVPPSNPFVSRIGARPEIWAFGLRNPWRYSFDRETGDLWIADVGQNRVEEINFQPASSRGGENYGWRTMEGLQCFNPSSGCNREGLTLPVHEYPRSQGVSITGGFVYRGSRFPALRGVYLYADFGSGRIWGLRRAGEAWENRELLSSGFQISAFGEDASGELYLTNHQTGAIFGVLSGEPATSAATIVNAASFGAGLVPGSLATLFGTGLTTFDGIVQATAFPLPRELGGISIRIDGTPAPLAAVARVGGQEQINFQIPFELAGAARASVVVRVGNVSSQPVEVPLVAAQPEIFALTRSGDSATIWATGLGAVSNAPATGAAAGSSPLSVTPVPATVTVDGADVPVTFSGLAPGFAGLYQVNINVPAGSSGDVVLRFGPAVSRAVPLR
jgi:uncharacterized protein (TIGR03437 family)